MADAKRAWIEAALLEHERALVLYARRFLHDEERARDVVQDAFLKLWQVERTEVEDHLVPWLYTVCRNRALDVRRKDRRMTTLGDAPVSTREGLESRAPGDDAGLVALVDGLPPRQREAVQLKFQAGLSYREIAKVMETTVNNVGVLIHTAVKSLRTRITEPATAGGSGSLTP